MAMRQSRLSTGYETQNPYSKVEDADQKAGLIPRGLARKSSFQKSSDSSGDEMLEASDDGEPVRKPGAKAKSKGSASGKIDGHSRSSSKSSKISSRMASPEIVSATASDVESERAASRAPIRQKRDDSRDSSDSKARLIPRVNTNSSNNTNLPGIVQGVNPK